MELATPAISQRPIDSPSPNSGRRGTPIERVPRMRDEALEPYWPVKPVREADLYFYLEAIEEYLPGNRVRIAGHSKMLWRPGAIPIKARTQTPPK